jgi:hypothetical protein
MIIDHRRQVLKPHWLRSTRTLTRSPLPEGGHTGPDAPSPRATSMKRPGDPPVTVLIHRAAHQKPARVGMTLPPAASAGTTLRGRGTSNVLGYRYATSLASSHTGYSPTKSCSSAGLLALWRRADPSIPIPLRRWSAATAPDGDSPAFPLVRAWVEPPAGIEPATPSLPSMRGWFTSPCTTSPTHATEQVKGAAEGCAVGWGEVACGAVSGKSLARTPSWYLC